MKCAINSLLLKTSAAAGGRTTAGERASDEGGQRPRDGGGGGGATAANDGLIRTEKVVVDLVGATSNYCSLRHEMQARHGQRTRALVNDHHIQTWPVYQNQNGYR